MKFLDRFSKNNQISSFIKIRPVGTDFFHADEQGDMTKLIVAFRKFANVPKTHTSSWFACKQTHVVAISKTYNLATNID